MFNGQLLHFVSTCSDLPVSLCFCTSPHSHRIPNSRLRLYTIICVQTQTLVQTTYSHIYNYISCASSCPWPIVTWHTYWVNCVNHRRPESTTRLNFSMLEIFDCTTDFCVLSLTLDLTSIGQSRRISNFIKIYWERKIIKSRKNIYPTLWRIVLFFINFLSIYLFFSRHSFSIKY